MQHVDHLVTKVADVRTKMANGNATANDVSDLAAHLQATQMFDAMAGGAKSEVARALNIMKATKHRARTFNDLEQSINDLSDAMGGGMNGDDMGAALDALIKANKTNGAKGFKDEVRKMRAMGWQDYVSYYIVMGYLTTPATAVRNAVGSVLHAGLSVGERYVAAGITTPLRRAFSGSKGSVEGITFREANAYVAGIYQSFADASRAGFRAFQTAAPVRDDASSLGDAAFNQPFLINAERKARWKQNPVLSIPDMAGAAIFSTIRTLGHRPSIAMDEFAKAMTYKMQLNALSVREASYRSARLKGADQAKEFSRVMDAVANGDNALSQTLQTVQNTVGGNTASITSLQQVTDGINARWTLALNSNGHLTGITANNNGSWGTLSFVADEVGFVSPNGGSPIKIMSVVANKVRFNSNVEIYGDLLVTGSINHTRLTNNTVNNVEVAYNAGTITLNNTTPTRIHGVWIGVEKADSPIDLDFNAYGTFTHNAGGSFVAVVQLVRSRGETGGTVIQSVQLNGSGMANDTWQGALPMKTLDRPNENGNWHYYVQVYFSSNMSTQTVTARYGKVTEMKNNTASLGGGTGSGVGVGSGGGSSGGGGYDPDPGFPGGGGGTEQPVIT